MNERAYLGRGLRFPLSIDGRGRLATSEGEQRVEESIAFILGTRLGERVMLPAFGCAANNMLFAGNDARTIGLLRHAVRESLATFEARIDVLDVDIENPPGQQNVLLVRIAYRIRSNNALGNLVYPFYIREAV